MFRTDVEGRAGASVGVNDGEDKCDQKATRLDQLGHLTRPVNSTGRRNRNKKAERPMRAIIVAAMTHDTDV